MAQTLANTGLSAIAIDEVAAWARELSGRGAAGISDLEHVLVARALVHNGAELPAETKAILTKVHADSVRARTGKSTDRVEPLPAAALADRRARVLQNSVFTNRGLFAGYVPAASHALVAGAAVAAGATATALTLAAAAGVTISSAVEHQIHVHVMHARPAVARFLNKHRTNPLVSNAANFFVIHKVIHHGETFLDDATTKWSSVHKEKADRLLAATGLSEFGQATDYGLQLTFGGAVAGALVGATAVTVAGVFAGLAVAPALALGLPMVLMPFFPHTMHRFSHMSRSEAAEHIDALEAKGGWRRWEAKLIRGIVKTRAFEAIARFHNQHHADDRHGTKTNMSMLAVADGLFLTGRRVDYDMLVTLWGQDAIGFPAAPATAV